MKLTEAIQFRQPLFEGFDDLENIFASRIDSIDDRLFTYIKVTWGDFIEAAYPDRIRELNYFERDPNNFYDPKVLKNMTRLIVQHPNSKIDLTDLMRKTKGEKETRINSILEILRGEMIEIMSVLFAPENQPPDSDLIKSTSDYKIVRLNNYSAARKLCNDYNTSFCIGSSDVEMFDQYGRHEDRDTFAIITSKKRVVVIQSGDNGYRITGHNNADEINETNILYADNMDVIVGDLVPPIPFDEVGYVLTYVIEPQYHENIEELVSEITGY